MQLFEKLTYFVQIIKKVNFPKNLKLNWKLTDAIVNPEQQGGIGLLAFTNSSRSAVKTTALVLIEIRGIKIRTQKKRKEDFDMKKVNCNTRRRRAVLVFTLAMMAAAISGCKGSSTDSTTAANGTTAAKSVDTSDSKESAGSRVVKIVQADKITGHDRYAVSNNAAKVSVYWGDFLVSTDHEGTFGPELATGWDWSEDYLTLTMTLRDDVYFQNDAKMTASDVAFTFNRILTDENLNNYRFRDNLTEAVAVDDTTVQFNFFKAMPSFLSEITQAPVLCQSAYEAAPDTYFDLPIGTGAYKMTYFDPSTGEVVFKRWDEWWGWGVVSEKTNVEEIQFFCMPDATTRLSSLRSGEYDIVEDITLDMVDTVKAEGFEVQSYFQQRHYFMAVNCTEGKVFADPSLRKAFSLCLDRQLIVDTIVGGGHVSDWVRPPMYLDYNEDTPGYPYDPDKAKELIEASDYNGEEIALLLGDGVMSRGSEVIQAIQAMGQSVGLNLNCQIMENTTVVDRRFAGEYDLAFAGMTGTNGENLNEVTELFGAMDKFKTGYVDEEQFSKIAAAVTIVDNEERAAALIEAEQMVFDSNAYIYLYEPLIACGINPRVTSVTLNSDGYQDLRFVKIAE